MLRKKSPVIRVSTSEEGPFYQGLVRYLCSFKTTSECLCLTV